MACDHARRLLGVTTKALGFCAIPMQGIRLLFCAMDQASLNYRQPDYRWVCSPTPPAMRRWLRYPLRCRALLLVSRGVVESRRHHEEFGLEGAKKTLQQSAASAKDLCRAVIEDIRKFMGTPPTHNDVGCIAGAQTLVFLCELWLSKRF